MNVIYKKPIFICTFYLIGFSCYAVERNTTGSNGVIHQDLPSAAKKIKKTIGKKVSVAWDKTLISYYRLQKLPMIREFVIVPKKSSAIKKKKYIWGLVIGRNRYVYFVQTSQTGGHYYTESNMFKLVDKWHLFKECFFD